MIEKIINTVLCVISLAVIAVAFLFMPPIGLGLLFVFICCLNST